VQTHRCPATVSGTKSAKTTEVLRLGKVQRVGTCREPGDLPYMALRCPCEGKGRQRVCADPDHSRLGFFYVWLPVSCGTALLPSRWGKRRGEASRGASRCPPYPRRHDEPRVQGCSTGCRCTRTRGSRRMGCLPSWVSGFKARRRGEPVRRSGRHLGLPGNICRWPSNALPPCGGSGMHNA
jgi:hypothetical protein